MRELELQDRARLWGDAQRQEWIIIETEGEIEKGVTFGIACLLHNYVKGQRNMQPLPIVPQ